MRRAAALAAAVAAVALAGCGDGDEAPASEAATELEITLDADGERGEPAREASLSCPGGDPPGACPAIAGLPDDPAAPVPPDTACTEIFGGPDIVRLEGSIEGEPIDAELTRANGCEIERFNRFTPLLQELFAGYRPGEAIVTPGG